MSSATDTKPLADVVKAGDVAMLVSHRGGKASSRPLTIAKVDGDNVLFLVDRTAAWFGDVTAGTEVHVAVSASGRNDWVSLNGTAQPSTDRALIDDLWSAPAAAYFDGGKDDPNITVLGVRVGDGEYWSAPGGGPFGRLISMVSTAIGKGPSGDHGAVN